MTRPIHALDLALKCAVMLAFAAGSALAVRPDGSMEVYRAPGAPASAGSAGSARERAAAALKGVDVHWNVERGVPSLVLSTNLPVVGPMPMAAQRDPAARAIRMMAGLAPAYGIQNADAELTAARTVTDSTGYRHVRLRQTYQGVPVAGSELIVHLDPDGRGRAVNGRFVPGLDLSVVPTLSAADATRAAAADQARMGFTAGALDAPPQLGIWARGATPVLAYSLTVVHPVSRLPPGRWRYWISAHDGSVLFRYNDVQYASVPPPYSGYHTTISGTILAGEGGGVKTVTGWLEDTGLYYLYNDIRDWRIFNMGGGIGSTLPDAGTYAHRTSNNWGTSDPVEMSAAISFDKIQTYYRTVHGRHSYDDQFARAEANVHYSANLANAFWSGSEFYFGDGDGVSMTALTVLDVAAHEFQHAVTDYTVPLTYAYESGAMSESWSDIFGALVEFNAQPDGRASYPNAVHGQSDWFMGEDCTVGATSLRDMRDPKSLVTQADGGQCPSRYKGSYWYVGDGDNGGVHYNCGVQNFYFYLLCEGGRGTNDGIAYDQAGIGITNGGRLAYLTLSSYLPVDADYADSRAAWVAAAQQADATALLTTKALARVMAAWGACGLGYTDRVILPYGFTSTGEPGVGPFVPETRTYRILNPTGTSETWQVSATEPWLLVDPLPVTVEAGAIGVVTVAVDQAVALALPQGVYRDTLTFDNATNGKGSTTRRAMLRIGASYSLRSAPYEWVDPVAAGHSVVPLTDGVSQSQGIPFDFNLYGVSFSSFYISADGLIGCFNDALTDGANVDMPQQDAPNAILCPMWDDLAGLSGFNVYMGEAYVNGYRSLVVTWRNAAHADDSAAGYSFQAVIRENAAPGDDNEVVFQYLDVSEDDLVYGSGLSATVGIEDEGGGASLAYAYEGSAWLSDTQAVLMTRNPPVDVTPPEADIHFYAEAPGSVTFELRFSEIVTNLQASDFIIRGTLAPHSTVSSVLGGGLRYHVVVSGYTNIYGSVGLLLPAGSVRDMDGNPNGEIGPFLYVLPVRSPAYANDFESGPVDWTPSVDVSGPYVSAGWEYGVPTYVGGPSNTTSGSNCWGTMLDGTYSNMMDARLDSVPVAVGQRTRIAFSAWYSLATNDYGFVEVFDGGVWRNVTPGGAFRGTSGDWVRQGVSLSDRLFANRSIRVRFRLLSNAGGTSAGLYVDDVQVLCGVTSALWVVGYSPTNVAPGGTYPTDLSLYNLSLVSRTGVSARVSTPSLGVSISGTNLLSYGILVPGEVRVLTSAVTLVVASVADLGVSVAEVFHEASAMGVAGIRQVLPISIDGMNETVGTNRIDVTTTLGVSDWMGARLRGNGDAQSALLQLIYAGTNGVIDPPGANGAPSGDDRVLVALPSGSTFGRFGEGYLIPPNSGRFLKSFKHGLAAGAKLYVRAWDASSFDGSVAYGESALYTTVAGAGQTNNFGPWVVNRPWDYYRDSDGDSIPDGWCVMNGRDPRVPVVGLTNQWSTAGAAGSSGNGALNLLYPGRVAVRGSYVYVADTQNSRIQIWNRALTARVGSFGSVGTGVGQFNQPNGLAVDRAAARLFVADTYNNRIVVLGVNNGTGALTYQTSIVSVVAFDRPRGVAVNSTGTVYVANTLGNNIQVFSPDFTQAGFIWGFYEPQGVAVDAGGRVYVADTKDDLIAVYEGDGTWVADYGTSGSGAGQFSRPADVQIGIGGRVYVADMNNHRLQVFRSDMTHLGTFAPPNGQMGSAVGQLRFPQGVYPSPDDNTVYIADTWNHRVQRMKVVIDGDADGMDDAWEDLHGLNSSDPSDGLTDVDGDGVLNVGEYRMGTDPRNIDSNGDGLYDGGALGLVTSVALGEIVDVGLGVPMILQWNAVSGGVYQVQTRLDLLDPSGWKPSATVTSWFNNVFTWPVDVSAQPDTNRFYRYIQLIP